MSSRAMLYRAMLWAEFTRIEPDSCRLWKGGDTNKMIVEATCCARQNVRIRRIMEAR
jgi:hypothetical protein